MNLIRTALRKPITVIVLVAGLFFFGVKAVTTVKIDIFPNIDLFCNSYLPASLLVVSLPTRWKPILERVT